jgi:hypothetical protein
MSPKNKIPTPSNSKKHYGHRPWFPFRFYDCVSLGYLWLTLLLAALSSRPSPIRERILVNHTLITLAILALIYFTEARPHSIRYRRVDKTLIAVRDLYPFFLFTFVLFGEFTYLANVFFPYWIEHALIRFDLWLFGEPPHRFIEQHTPAWIIELMAFAYWTYFPLVAYVALRYYRAYEREANCDIGRLSPKRAEFLDFMN